jgi:tetratricopeptide (TPR) repeat protein
LSGGTGTYAFLIGVGRFIGNKFSLTQLFMQDPSEEPAQLFALEEYLASCDALVTFNGKAFDIPLLMTRYRTHDWKPLISSLYHIDLLHLSRRLWRDRLTNRSLNSLEVHILSTQRTEDDVPGWMIPQLYFNYLRDGDIQPLKSVFYHNAMDILSLAALFNHQAALLADPTGNLVNHGIDLLSLGQLFEDLGETTKAIELYSFGLEHEDAQQERIPRDILLRAIFRMAMIHKRAGDMDKALQLWEQATQYHYIPAYVELAKYYEHKIHDYDRAMMWTQKATSIINNREQHKILRLRWGEELEHRMKRLIHKKG